VIGRQDHNGPAGKGHTEEGEPMFTLTSTDTHAVAVQYDGYNQRVNETDVDLTIRIGRDSSDFIAQPSEPIMSPTLTAYNMDSRSPQSEEQQRIVNAVFESTMAVRRLTPLECERLMGWPDDHTRYKADGTEQADTHRYKQCGNGVASPVAQWIAKHILAI
jgi:DNA (cytosine-5)-methyltransferase 1